LEKRAQKFATFLAPQLGTGEFISVVLSSGQSGPSPWLLTSLGLIGYLVLAPFTRYYAIAVSNQRVFVVRLSWMGRPKETEGVYPIALVRVVEFKPGQIYGTLSLARPDAPDLKLSFPRPLRPEAEGVAAALA
jgi:hypothetical protein